MKLQPSSLLSSIPLKFKITLYSCTLLILSLSTFWLLTKGELQRTMQAQADALGTAFALQTADSVRELVLANDLLSLKVVLDQITSNENILKVSVYDIDDSLLASSQNSSNSSIAPASSTPQPEETFYDAQIFLQGAIAGSVLLQLDTRPAQISLALSQTYFWSILVSSLLLALIAAFFLASCVTGPIQTILHAILTPETSALEKENTGTDEIALLQNACAGLLEKHKQAADEQQSLSTVQDSDKNENINDKPLKVMASVLIVKVVNINTAIELLHPSTLSRLLNEYLFYLTQAAKLYGGRVNRFTGDSVMVSFDSRQSSEKYSFNAICCAQLFQMLMSRISQQHRTESSQALEFRLAIHSGETFMTLGTNAKQEIQNQALIGKTIETSYFLSKQSKPGQLIISETAFEQAGGENSLPCEDSTEITMPTDNMSFMAYILKGNSPQCSELLEKQCTHILPKESGDSK